MREELLKLARHRLARAREALKEGRSIPASRLPPPDLGTSTSHEHEHESERYSARQDAKLKMGGVVGEAVYEGLSPFDFPALWLPYEVLHVGKVTAMGLGRFPMRDWDSTCSCTERAVLSPPDRQAITTSANR